MAVRDKLIHLLGGCTINDLLKSAEGGIKKSSIFSICSVRGVVPRETMNEEEIKRDIVERIAKQILENNLVEWLRTVNLERRDEVLFKATVYVVSPADMQK